MPQFNASLFNSALFGGQAQAAGPVVEVGTGLLYPALRKAGVTLGPGRTPSPAQFQDAIDELNRLNGSLNADRLFIYSEDTTILDVQNSQITYTIGQDPTGATIADFDVPRPQLITRANYISGAPPIRYEIAVLTPQQWAMIGYQTSSATIPYALYDDYAYPLSTLYLYGQPPAGNQLEIWSWHRVPQFATVTDVVMLPDQYLDTLVLNLAVRLAPQFQRDVRPDVMQQARESLMRLESINAPQPIADTSSGMFGCGCNRGYNVYTDR